MLAFPAGAAPFRLLEALGVFFPVEDAPLQDQPEAIDEPGQEADNLDLGLELGADEDDEYLSANRRPPALPPPSPSPPPPPPGSSGRAPRGGRRLCPRPGTPPAQGWDLRCSARAQSNLAAGTNGAAHLRRAMTSPPRVATHRPQHSSLLPDRQALGAAQQHAPGPV